MASKACTSWPSTRKPEPLLQLDFLGVWRPKLHMVLISESFGLCDNGIAPPRQRNRCSPDVSAFSPDASLVRQVVVKLVGRRTRVMPAPDVRWLQRLDNYKRALATLQRAIALTAERELSELEEQRLIQAFEFTHEMSWLLLKDFLADQGVSGISVGFPRFGEHRSGIRKGAVKSAPFCQCDKTDQPGAGLSTDG
jgi:hypothetical protein